MTDLEHFQPSLEQVVTFYQFAAEEQFPGKVVLRKYLLLIEALVTLPSDDFLLAREFQIPKRSLNLKEGEYVTFSCSIPIRSKNREQLPYARNLKRINESQARNLAEQFRQKLAINAKHELTQDLILQQEQLDKEKAEFEQKAQTFEARDQELKQREVTLKQSESIANHREAELDQRESRLRPFLPENETRTPSEIRPSSDFTHLFDDWLPMLSAEGHFKTNDGTAELGFLLGFLCSSITGGLTLLDGPVGVGKTSIVKRAANLLSEGDGAFDLVPVRPGWIDSTDLVGFYDPTHREFQPSTFITALNRASHCPERLHLICLDELNLARIENYGADLLSCMEYRQEIPPHPLPLYSPEVKRSLAMELDLISIENTSLESKDTIRAKKLAQMLRSFPAEFQIPPNAVIIGTLNSDETTYDISPKVIDRSFVVRMPIADLNVSMTQDSHEPQTCVIDFYDLRATVNAKLESQVGFDLLLKEITKLQEPLKNLGIPLGYRVRRDLNIFTAIAQAVGLENVEEIFKYFLFLKILPRIRCQRSERTRDAWGKFQILLKPFQRRDLMGVIEDIERQWDDPSCYTIRYFG